MLPLRRTVGHWWNSEDIQDELVFADGAWNENAAVFELKDSLDTVLALDVDYAVTDDEVVKEAEAAGCGACIRRFS